MTRARARVVAVLAVATVLGLLAPVGSDARTLPNLETFELPSDLIDPRTDGGRLEGGRSAPKVHVLLPDGYADDPTRRWPVLWLLHGANGGTDTWIPGIAHSLNDLPAIVVMPDGGLFGMYVNWWSDGARARPSWATYHLEVLRQLVHERYRIRPGRRWHAIGGISMGGQGALRYAAMLPGYFGSVVALSAAFPDMQSLQAQGGINLLGAVGAAPAPYERIFGPREGAYAEGNSPQALTVNLARTRLYLTSGSGLPCLQDPLTSSFALDVVTESALNAQRETFAVRLREVGADVTSVQTCGVHTFGVWERAWPLAREWGFFGDVEEAPERWVYRTIATRGEMWGLRFAFAAPPSTVARFERTGDVLAGQGSGEVAISGPPGCELSVTLPFSQSLPNACWVPT